MLMDNSESHELSAEKIAFPCEVFLKREHKRLCFHNAVSASKFLSLQLYHRYGLNRVRPPFLLLEKAIEIDCIIISEITYIQKCMSFIHQVECVFCRVK